MLEIIGIYLVGVVLAWFNVAYINDNYYYGNEEDKKLHFVIVFTSYLFNVFFIIFKLAVFVSKIDFTLPKPSFKKLFKKKNVLSLLLLMISTCAYSGTAYHYQRTVFDNKFQRTILDPKAVNVTIGKNGKVFTFIDTSEGSDRITTSVVNVGSLINNFGDNSINYVATDEDGNELRITLITTIKTNSYSTIIIQTFDKLTVYQLINK